MVKSTKKLQWDDNPARVVECSPRQSALDMCWKGMQNHSRPGTAVGNVLLFTRILNPCLHATHHRSPNDGEESLPNGTGTTAVSSIDSSRMVHA